MPTCRLCKRESALRNSHIVPEFLYGDLYNDKNQMMGVNGQGNRGWRVVQKGLRETLLCETCEQHFNEYFEKPFRTLWIERRLLPDPWDTAGVRLVQVEYAPFKLFHLSVLFRAGVSSLPTYQAVSLGPHEEVIRKLLLARSPGDPWQYPIFGYAVIHPSTKRLIQMVSQAQRSKIGGRRCYGMMYGGAEWWIGVSSDRNKELMDAALRPNGQMPFHAVPWNEVGVVQDVSYALNRSAPHDQL